MRTNNRTLKCESLESRELMAGNVTVNLAANEVIVRGDSRANQIEVFQLDNGAYRIVGHNGTTINGRAFVDRTSSDRDLRIFMGGGDDTVVLGNAFSRASMIVEDLEIDMGSGKDNLAIGNLKSTDNQPMSIRMGGSENETDRLAIEKADIKTGLKVDMGGGSDQVEIKNTRIRGKLDVRLGSGADSLKLVDTVFASSYLDGGSGNDTYKRTRGTAGTLVNF